MKKKVKRVRFKGFDWTEVAYALGAKKPKRLDDDESSLQKCVEDAVNDAYNDIMESIANGKRKLHPDTKRTVGLCRRFTKACAYSMMTQYRASLWNGLYAIEDDGTFLSYFRLLYPSMWT